MSKSPLKEAEVILIDGSSFIYRAYFAIPGFLASSKGIPTKASFGVTQMLLKLLSEVNTDYIVWFSDEAKPTFRHELYKDYKATRPSMPEDLKVQIPYIKTIVKSLGIVEVSLPGYEADDLIATFVKSVLEKESKSVLIVAGDRDLYTLLSEKVSFFDPVREKFFTLQDFLSKYQFEPEFFPHFRALTGDRSDNIPGVKGIGEKSAKELIKRFHTLEAIYESLSKVTQKRIRDALIKGKEDAFKSLELVKLKTDAPLPSKDLSYYKRKEPDYQRLKEIFKELEFKKFLKDLNLPSQKLKITLKTSLPKSLPKESLCLILPEKKGNLNLFAQRREEVYACFGENEVYLTELSQVKPYASQAEVFLFDYKKFLKLTNTRLNRVLDAKLAVYLLNPSSKPSDPETLVKEWTDISPSKEEEVAVGLYRACITLKHRLKEEGLLQWLSQVEVPLSEVLYDMETTGFKVDTSYLRELLRSYSQKIKEVEEEIFSIAGKRFNPRSSREVGEVLFKKLKLPILKKTPKGHSFSTDAEVLEELAALHPLPRLLLKYRSLYKIKSTYIEPLLTLASSQDHRVRTEFSQTTTATGRLSSKNPNLQNIPVRGEEGFALRRAFIAEKGWVLCSMDYSQIELRILAHFSGDENLISAFERGEDIHTFTACEVFGVPPEKVTPEMRRMSKAINFGIAYGMSAYGLSKELKISVKEAEEIISRYFKRYPGIKDYIEKTVEFAKKHGFVKTIAGRKRFVPEVYGSTKAVRELGYRIAVNTPIQGSASDLIKCAMVLLHKKLKEKGLKSRLVLQIHDELILEVPEDELEETKNLGERVMTSPFKELGILVELKVPLKVNVAYGKTWAECKS